MIICSEDMIHYDGVTMIEWKTVGGGCWVQCGRIQLHDINSLTWDLAYTIFGRLIFSCLRRAAILVYDLMVYRCCPIIGMMSGIRTSTTPDERVNGVLLVYIENTCPFDSVYETTKTTYKYDSKRTVDGEVRSASSKYYLPSGWWIQ